MSDGKPRMDLAFALRTLDAYTEENPALTQSDRFWFDLAARFLAARFREQADELRVARALLTSAKQVGFYESGVALRVDPAAWRAYREQQDGPVRPDAGTLAAVFGAEDEEADDG